MYNFIAVVSGSTHTAALPAATALRDSLRQQPQKWRPIINSDTLAVYSQTSFDPAMRTYLLPENNGVVLGRLFRNGCAAQPIDPAEICPTTTLRSGGARLLAQYWGSYVAILRSHEDQTVLVCRDCSGKMPCYYLEISGLYVFFSDIRDLEAMGLQFTINSRYLAAFILHHPLHVRETGLRQVSELLAGDCVALTPKGVSHSGLWNPLELVDAPPVDNYSHAKSEMIAITEQVIQCWASIYDGILLSLSGGLDSAIVLGCLKRMGAADRVVCVNEYMENTRDDERQYARSAAKMANVRLIELARNCDAALFVEKLRNAPADPNPYVTTGFRLLSADGFQAIAAQFGCNSVWTGQGGDHVFLQIRDTHPAADYLMKHWFPSRLPAVLYETARLSGHSVWSTLRHAIQCRWRNGYDTPVPFKFSGENLVNQSALCDVPPGYATPQWHVTNSRVPPGKLTQIDIFSDLLNRHKPLIDHLPYECHPLISQPLLELSLRIPTYHLVRGGRQRAMARDAFADRVPACILRREDKGGILDQSRVLLRGCADLLRDLLLDGALVSLGIVNRQTLERLIVSEETYKPAEIFSLAGCIAAEMWATHWINQTATRVSAGYDGPNLARGTI